VTEVRSATGAKYFIALHPQAVVFHRHNISGNEWLGKTGPTGAGLKFPVTGKKRRAAADTSENSPAMLAQQNGKGNRRAAFSVRPSVFR